VTSGTAQSVETALREAHTLHRAGRLDEARNACRRILKQQPRQPQALLLLGIISAQTGDARGAVARFDEVLALEPRSFAAYGNRGNALLALREPAAALASYDAAIALDPRHAATYNGRGKALFALRQFEAAIASQDEALRLQPDYPAALFDRALALMARMRYEAALASLDASLALDPRHAGAWYVRANALYSLGQHEAALESYDRAIALRPDDARAHHNRGHALFMLERPAEAVASYDRALALDPDLRSTHGARLHARMHSADWRGFAAELAQLVTRIEAGEAASNPFAVLALTGSPRLQQRAAENWVREQCPPNPALGPLAAPAGSAAGTASTLGAGGGPREKLRIGYFSAEFHGHATAALTAELFEIHDRSRFELSAFSLGPDAKDASRLRLKAAFDHFHDVRAQSDEDIAQLARSSRVDIAVDLGGFTRGGRPGIFALRAAPAQVSYLGYLGTMSAEYMDYLIADDTLIPPSQRRYYRERIIYLPSYQVNDSKRPIAPRRFSRQELGLPPEGFIYCCFNSTYKITPDTFDSWMRILTRVPRSVLFLLGGGAALEDNLRREAADRGVEPDRLVFGAKLPAPEYLARYRTADLFLDTFPYNAGATGSDALWAGLPVLTRSGDTFASRMGASLLKAAGLPELIASSAGDYEERAVELASHPPLLAAIRARLAGDLRATALYDTAAFARHLERAYTRMAERLRAGAAPEDLRIETP
jgi:predicted O-linked N-acetylglucosamine transferase (SPINDLY family)